jgi:CCR4-NOT transcription complex subunit 1
MEIRQPPALVGDYEAPLRRAGVQAAIDMALTGQELDRQVATIVRAVHEPPRISTGIGHTPVTVDEALLTSLVLYVGNHAVSVVGSRGGPTFVQDAPHADLLRALVHELKPEGRYYLLSVIANQLRYPNSHTHYFSYALLFLFGTDHNDQMESDVRQQITRVLLERLIAHRPHPWGLIITLLELLKNPSYMFWDLPFIKAAPEARSLCSNFMVDADRL